MSYATVQEADAYFTARLPSDEWDLSDEPSKIKALATASRRIDNLCYFGAKTAEDQEHQFPRNGKATVPTSILYACYEIAYALLEGYDSEKDLRSAVMQAGRFGSAGVTRSVDDTPMHILHGIPSATAWMYLRPFLNTSMTVRIERIS